MVKHILVIGGTGFLGQRLVRALHERGHAVRVLVRPSARSSVFKPLGVECVSGNALDGASLREDLRALLYGQRASTDHQL